MMLDGHAHGPAGLDGRPVGARQAGLHVGGSVRRARIAQLLYARDGHTWKRSCQGVRLGCARPARAPRSGMESSLFGECAALPIVRLSPPILTDPSEEGRGER